MTGEDVTECLGGAGLADAADLARRYVTQCDPRLNPAQAREVVTGAARLLPGLPTPVLGAQLAAA